MNSEYNKIREIAEKAANENELILIDFIMRGTSENPVVEVFIDGQENVSAEKCAKVSGEIKKLIESANFFKSYRLDVSSPGVDRPLINFQQYSKHVNRMFEIKYKSDDEVMKMNAKLVGIEGKVLTFYDNTEIKVKFDDIIKAKVLVSFNQRR